MAPWLASPTNLAYLASTPLFTALLGGFQAFALAAITSSLTSMLRVFDSAEIVTTSPFWTRAIGPPTSTPESAWTRTYRQDGDDGKEGVTEEIRIWGLGIGRNTNQQLQAPRAQQ